MSKRTIDHSGQDELPPLGDPTKPHNVRVVQVGRFAFEFASKQDWVNRGQQAFKRHRAAAGDSVLEMICIDSRGRICTTGRQFMRAEDDGAYPVKVYETHPEEP